MTERPLTVYIDASLVTVEGAAAIGSVIDLGLRPTVVGTAPEMAAGSLPFVDEVPADLGDAWYLTDWQTAVNGRALRRTIVIGPRREPGRRAEIGIRTARDLRTALLELASEHATD